MKIRITNHSGNPLPSYETDGAAGMDLRAHLDAPVVLESLERTIIPTGLRIELPKGYEAQIRVRSGLAIKKGIALVNAPGTIDSDYRGDIGIIIVNLSSEPVTIEPGTRIAQMVIARHERALWEEVNELEETKRGAGGFGHTGD